MSVWLALPALAATAAGVAAAAAADPKRARAAGLSPKPDRPRDAWLRRAAIFAPGLALIALGAAAAFVVWAGAATVVGWAVAATPPGAASTRWLNFAEVARRRLAASAASARSRVGALTAPWRRAEDVAELERRVALLEKRVRELGDEAASPRAGAAFDERAA